VGWHNPWAEFTYEGGKYELKIAGGCKAIVVSQTKGTNVRYFSVDIRAIVAAMMPLVQKKMKEAA
jgi:hypothetical protein